MREIKFQYKGQAINYFNKVQNNAKIAFCTMSFDCAVNAYIIRYRYK